jgi:riboflavin kinase / FMN adenylyltransferase
MRLIRGQHNLRSGDRGCVLSIGNFDGVHRGHQALLALARGHADRLGLPLAVLTFDPTPREFFTPAQAPPRVATLHDKLDDLARHGVDRVLLQRFDARFAALTPAAFVHDLLGQRLGVRLLVVGDDFRFGQARAGDVEFLRRAGPAAGFELAALPTVQEGAQRCSSTRLRAALAAADLDQAARLLGHPYRLSGRVRRGLQLGRTLAMPTANLPLRHAPALRLGVYAVEGELDGRCLPGVANLGVRPTLGHTPCLLETHFFEPPGELYGHCLRVRFHRFLRPEQRFDSLDALAAQMQHDKAAARACLRER